MVVCQFYQRGNCKFGGKRLLVLPGSRSRFTDSCYKEHPGSQRDANRNPGSGGSAFGGASNNRFSAFGGGDRYRPGQASGMLTLAQHDPITLSGSYQPSCLIELTMAPLDSKPSYNLDKNDIRNDLTGQRPIYPLSSYGPGKDAPRQLIEGPVDISPEELRLRYYTLRDAGNESGAVS
jgi:nucleoporin NUP42